MAKYSNGIRYDLPEHLHCLYFRDPLFRRVVRNSSGDGYSYTQMLEAAVNVLSNHAADCQRREMHAIMNRKIDLDETRS